MTPEKVRDLVQKIREKVEDGDDEALHSKEDNLHIAVLKAIADGSAKDPVRCAKAALETLDFDFSRWCA